MNVFFYVGTFATAFFCCFLSVDLLSANSLSKFAEPAQSEMKPIAGEVIAKDGAKVRIYVDSFEYSRFHIDGEGFKPYESLNFISNSCDEFIYTTIKAGKNGEIVPMGLSPAVIGKSGGTCYIDIFRDTNSIHLTFPWGK